MESLAGWTDQPHVGHLAPAYAMAACLAGATVERRRLPVGRLTVGSPSRQGKVKGEPWILETEQVSWLIGQLTF